MNVQTSSKSTLDENLHVTDYFALALTGHKQIVIKPNKPTYTSLSVIHYEVLSMYVRFCLFIRLENCIFKDFNNVIDITGFLSEIVPSSDSTPATPTLSPSHSHSR